MDVVEAARVARRPVVGPSAWVGGDMKQREAEWTYRFSATELAELEAAAAAVRGRDLATLTRADFPLPTLGPVLDDLRREVVDGRGFVLLRGLPVEDRPVAESATLYWGLGTHFGSARSQNGKGHLLGHVYDLGQGLSATNPLLRSYQTAERQRFHIDRADLVALLCLRPAKSGGGSSFVSSMTVHNVMAERRPDLLERLYRPFPTDRRGEIPEGKAPFYEAPVFNEHEDRVSVLYSRLHIGSSQRFPDAPRLAPEDLEALDLFGELAGDPDLRLDMNFTPGDIQILHNHTILHARSAYEDWLEPDRKRHLLRLWLCPPDARPLPPIFAEVYGRTTVGDRGGIICPGTRLHAPLVPA
ncbi:MAG TPA: TauD/TfdA family dioxygenase [Stellaceae bacterium]|nr:TauD/TfdA family dioxygenase [Stellaceae bacterium]